MGIELTGEYHTDCNLLMERIKELEGKLLNGKHWAEKTLEVNDHEGMHYMGNTPDWFVGLAAFICDVDKGISEHVAKEIRKTAVDDYLHNVFTQPISVTPSLLMDIAKKFK